MRALTRTLIALALATATGPRSSEAQSITSPYRYIERGQEWGPFAGHMSVDRGRFGYGPGGGTFFGGRWGAELSGPLSFEAVAAYLPGTRDVMHPGRVEGDRKIGEADVQLMLLDARLKFSLVGNRTWHGLNPFIVAGGGIALDLADPAPIEATLEPGDAFEFGTSFLGTLGVGTRWFATERVTLRSDAIFSLWEIPTPLGFADPARGFSGVDENEWVRGLQISASLHYRW